jgi:hypothetical protein
MKQDFDGGGQIPWRIGGPKYSTQPALQNYAARPTSIVTAYQDHQQYQHSAATAFSAPSPFDYHPQNPFNNVSSSYTNDARLALTPPGVSSYENEMVNFQNEMEETMFGAQDSGYGLPQPPTSTARSTLQLQSDYTQSSGRKPSWSTHDSHSSATALPGNLAFSKLHHGVQELWQPPHGQVQQINAVPIANKISFMPNHIMSSYDSYDWASDGATPVSSISSDGLGLSFVSSSYDQGQHNFGHTSTSVEAFIRRPGWANDDLTAVNAHGHAHWQNHQGNNFNHPHAVPLHQSAPNFQSDDYQHRLISSPDEDDNASMASMPDVPWGSFCRPIKSMKCTDDKMNKDDILLQCRSRGMSYKEIKRTYNFPEAESTLRGRHRTLTKDKKDRVRKPEWTARDVSFQYRHRRTVV